MPCRRLNIQWKQGVWVTWHKPHITQPQPIIFTLLQLNQKRISPTGSPCNRCPNQPRDSWPQQHPRLADGLGRALAQCCLDQLCPSSSSCICQEQPGTGSQGIHTWHDHAAGCDLTTDGAPQLRLKSLFSALNRAGVRGCWHQREARSSSSKHLQCYIKDNQSCSCINIDTE